jgi:CDP-2,3-bis-(O-geranylgeranyl)-sn-glycerol synthase
VDIAIALLTPLWLLFPAMTSNSWAVIFGGGAPMDFGRSWRGKRIFGDGKTWRGFFCGIFFGTLVGLAEMLLIEVLMNAGVVLYSPTHWGFGAAYLDAIPLLVALCTGALLGDTAKSFIKRRLGMERGHRVPFLDWYDFLLGALALSFIFYFGWTLDNLFLTYNWVGMIFLLFLIPPLHRLFNIVGYKIGKKNVPW